MNGYFFNHLISSDSTGKHNNPRRLKNKVATIPNTAIDSVGKESRPDLTT